MGLLEDIQATVNDTNARVRHIESSLPSQPPASTTTTTTVPPAPATTTTTFPPAPAPNALKGFNIGNDQNVTPAGTPYNKAQNDADLAYLKGVSMAPKRLRIAFTYGKDLNDLANLKQFALAAKAQGFAIMFGITCGVDDAYWPSFLGTDMINLAKWCEVNHIEEFGIGNEESWRSHIGQSKIPEAQIRNDVRNAVAKIRAVYSGQIVYCDAQGVMDAWIAEGRGALDRIYFNVYDNFTNFKTLINKAVAAFGKDHTGLSEWAAEHGYTEMLANGYSDVSYAQEIANREAVVEASSLPAYAFTWRMDPKGTAWEFVYGGNLHRPGLDRIIGS